MPTLQYIYQDRAVIFLDVLGFQEKLIEFEKEATEKKEEGDAGNREYYFSEGVNDFINTFKEAVSFLDDTRYNYYLFSDNICITVDYIQNPNLLVDILETINDLFLKFAERGYFLRGGMEIGKFVDEKSIAVGVPLAKAYQLEQRVALYPRIVISNNYKKTLDGFENSLLLSEKSISLKKYLVKNHCEVYYLNTFFNLVSNDNKADILKTLRDSILRNLEINGQNEYIAIKYEWLASEFNSFIDNYVSELKFLETDIPTEAEVEIIKSLKIVSYAN